MIIFGLRHSSSSLRFYNATLFLHKMKHVTDNFVFSDGSLCRFQLFSFYPSCIYLLFSNSHVYFVCVSNSIVSRGVRKIMMIYIWLDTEFSEGVESKKNRSILVQEMSNFTQKTISLLNEDVKKGKKGERHRETARCVIGHRK